jgi:hypothetical protein
MIICVALCEVRIQRMDENVISRFRNGDAKHVGSVIKPFINETVGRKLCLFLMVRYGRESSL